MANNNQREYLDLQKSTENLRTDVSLTEAGRYIDKRIRRNKEKIELQDEPAATLSQNAFDAMEAEKP